VTEPGAGEVLVRIVVSSVNPTDWRSRRGSALGEALAFDDGVPGQDGAAVVEAVGAGATHVAMGDRV
jgi:NADPH2:quinone reductase